MENKMTLYSLCQAYKCFYPKRQFILLSPTVIYNVKPKQFYFGECFSSGDIFW